jgi:hypothetical protein
LSFGSPTLKKREREGEKSKNRGKWKNQL